MKVTDFIHSIEEITGAEPFFTGVPDSLLKPLCDYLFVKFGTQNRHIVAANEGNAVGIAAGYYFATGKPPIVYLQNSGEGNIVNPVASLLNERVYGVPCVFVVGWRGEPNVPDEPQHIFQGMITVKLLEDLEITSFVLGKDNTQKEVDEFCSRACKLTSEGKSVAFVIKKGALESTEKAEFKNGYSMTREEVIRQIVATSGDDVIVSTTGKASRELFEIREANKEGHKRDFLTVGSMGHSSSVALGVALNRPERRVWCIDGDGAVLMHMGAMSVIGAQNPSNFVHVVINNGAHESVGGMPTALSQSDLFKVAEGCGYRRLYRVSNYEELSAALNEIKTHREFTFLEAYCAIGSRADLGRPTTTAKQNKEAFMEFLR